MSSCILKDLSIYEKYVSLECKPLSKIMRQYIRIFKRNEAIYRLQAWQ